MKSGIYSIKSIQKPDFEYIGSAAYLAMRKAVHFHSLRKNKHYNIKLQRHFNKYGEGDLVFQIIEYVENKKYLIVREQHYIDTLCPKFNVCKIAGSWLGNKHTVITKKKLSEQKSGQKNHFYGRKYTDEEKKKMSDRQKGEKAFNFGRKFSAETIEKWRKASTGRKKSRQTILKISGGNNPKAKSVIDTKSGVIYGSIKEAAIEIGMNQTTLREKLLGLYKNETNFKLHGQRKKIMEMV